MTKPTGSAAIPQRRERPFIPGRTTPALGSKTSQAHLSIPNELAIGAEESTPMAIDEDTVTMLPDSGARDALEALARANALPLVEDDLEIPRAALSGPTAAPVPHRIADDDDDPNEPVTTVSPDAAPIELPFPTPPPPAMPSAVMSPRNAGRPSTPSQGARAPTSRQTPRDGLAVDIGALSQQANALLPPVLPAIAPSSVPEPPSQIAQSSTAIAQAAIAADAPSSQVPPARFEFHSAITQILPEPTSPTAIEGPKTTVDAPAYAPPAPPSSAPRSGRPPTSPVVGEHGYPIVSRAALDGNHPLAIADAQADAQAMGVPQPASRESAPALPPPPAAPQTSVPYPSAYPHASRPGFGPNAHAADWPGAPSLKSPGMFSQLSPTKIAIGLAVAAAIVVGLVIALAGGDDKKASPARGNATDPAATPTERAPTDPGAKDPADHPGMNNTATDNAATDNTATDNAATDNAATDNAATDNAATDSAATDNAATDNAATGNAATDNAATGNATKPASITRPATKPQTETKPASKPATKPQTETKPATTKPPIETKAATIGKPATKPQTETKPATATKPQIETKAGTIGKPATKPQTETKPAAATKPQIETKAATIGKPATKPQTETKPASVGNPATKPQTETKPASKPGTKPTTKPATKPNPTTKPKPTWDPNSLFLKKK